MLDKCNIQDGKKEETGFNREKLLILSSSVLKKLEARMTSGPRFREQKSDQTYLGYVRALSGLITAHNAVLKDQELTDLEKRISALEEPDKIKERVYE
ncbi:MAG: hypothetical protein PHV39_06200 [Methanomicrobium sp.]|nr:hypothetical protein [Methanomicrobium sp.]